MRRRRKLVEKKNKISWEGEETKLRRRRKLVEKKKKISLKEEEN